MANILITGRTGYIASALYAHLKDEYQLTMLGRSDLDLSNSRMVNEWFSDKHFDIVIHTATTGGHRLHPDDTSVLDTNLRMYYNLLDNRNHYVKFINIGSGAESYNPTSPYGLSKSIIRSSILDKENFYSIRAYNVFDENELDTRFIKSNLIRYINKEKMIIHQNKRMDFFYMKDFITLMKYYINTELPPKEIDCSYEKSWSLFDILLYVNFLSTYAVEIDIQNKKAKIPDYVGKFHNLGLQYIGLHKGITSVYEKLTCKESHS